MQPMNIVALFVLLLIDSLDMFDADSSTKRTIVLILYQGDTQDHFVCCLSGGGHVAETMTVLRSKFLPNSEANVSKFLHEDIYGERDRIT